MGNIAAAGTHSPDPGSWDCRAGDGPWPCDVARESLRSEYQGDRLSLAMLMGGYLAAFTKEKPGSTDSVARFVGWTRSPRPAATPPLFQS